MQKLSTVGFGKAKFWAFAIGVSVAMLMLVAPVLAASYALTVQTDKSSYSGSDTIHITGKVTPAPGPNTAVFVQVKDPNGKNVDVGSEAVDPTTGAYSHTTVAGGPTVGPNVGTWISGTYTVNASWGASGTVIFQTTTFAYTATTTTTTTTSSSTTSTTTTSTTTTSSTHSTTTSTSSSTTTSTSSTIPEFNPEALLIVSLAALAAIAVVGRTRLNKGPPAGV